MSVALGLFFAVAGVIAVGVIVFEIHRHRDEIRELWFEQNENDRDINVRWRDQP